MDELTYEMFNVLKATHNAMDWLIAQVCSLDPKAMPTKMPIWPTMIASHQMIIKAELVAIDDAWAQLKRVFDYLDNEADVARNAFGDFKYSNENRPQLTGHIVIHDNTGWEYDRWIGVGDACSMIAKALRSRII